LKDPKKFQRLGGRIPKGILMIGPPVRGKTLLARPSREADAAFFSISGSILSRCLSGGCQPGAGTCEQARRNTPCWSHLTD